MQNDQIFHDKIVTVLELFAKYVTYCEIRLTRMFMNTSIVDHNNRSYDLENTYLNLIGMLDFMLNLKVLQIRSHGKVY